MKLKALFSPILLLYREGLFVQPVEKFVKILVTPDHSD